MSNVKFVLDQKAFRKNVLQSQEMLELTESYAKAQPCDHTKSFVGFDRAKTICYPNAQKESKK